MTDLVISTSQSDDRRVVAVGGEADLSNAPEFAAAINAAVQHGGERVEVDLAGLRFCDSSGIRVLVHARRSADEHGVSLRIVGAQDLVRNVLEITGVWTALSTWPSK